MLSGFNTYIAWVRNHPRIWEFENDPNPTDSDLADLRVVYEHVLKALEDLPHFIHPNAFVHASAVLSGAIVIERGAQILANSVINGPAYIGCDAVVGNFSLLRRFCFLARNSLVGNHSYCNEAVIGRSARVAHYVNCSRSLIAYNSSLSAFALTATVRADKAPITDARKRKVAKMGAVIGANTFISPHTTLQPGVTIGHECFIGSFSTIRNDVPSGTFVETVQEVRTKKNKVRIPKRNMVNNFLLESAPASQRRYAGVLLVDRHDRFVLQRRDTLSGTYNPGMLSMFGGRLEENEDSAACAIRELHEETGMQLSLPQLTFLGETLFTREDGTQTHCSMYCALVTDIADVSVNEGRGFELLEAERVGTMEDLTQLCCTAIAEYIRLRPRLEAAHVTDQ